MESPLVNLPARAECSLSSGFRASSNVAVTSGPYTESSQGCGANTGETQLSGVSKVELAFQPSMDDPIGPQAPVVSTLAPTHGGAE